jgi:formylglycine-generating enzyme required for sulfatase activity
VGVRRPWRGRHYPWGDETPDAQRANFSDTQVGDPTPVGIFPGDGTPEGVLDLAGNVREWCLDAHSEGFYGQCRRQGVVADPLASEDVGAPRVVRGGAFIFWAGVLRSSVWYWGEPWIRFRHFGFRCVLAPPRQR